MFTRAQFIYNHKFRKISLLWNTEHYKNTLMPWSTLWSNAWLQQISEQEFRCCFEICFVNYLKKRKLSSSDSAATNTKGYICTLNSQVKNMLFEISFSPVTNIQNGRSSYEIRRGRPTDIHTKVGIVQFMTDISKLGEEVIFFSLPRRSCIGVRTWRQSLSYDFF